MILHSTQVEEVISIFFCQQLQHTKESIADGENKRAMTRNAIQSKVRYAFESATGHYASLMCTDAHCSISCTGQERLSYRIACALDQLLYLHASLEVNIRKSASFDPHVIWDPTCHKFSDLLMLLSTRSTAIFRRPDARNLCLRRCSSSRHPPDSRVLTG